MNFAVTVQPTETVQSPLWGASLVVCNSACGEALGFKWIYGWNPMYVVVHSPRNLSGTSLVVNLLSQPASHPASPPASQPAKRVTGSLVVIPPTNQPASPPASQSLDFLRAYVVAICRPLVLPMRIIILVFLERRVCVALLIVLGFLLGIFAICTPVQLVCAIMIVVSARARLAIIVCMYSVLRAAQC